MGDKQVKIIALGDSLIDAADLLRAVGDMPGGTAYASTIGVKMNQYRADINPNKSVSFVVWGLTGGDQFQGMAKMYLKGAKGGIIFADVSETETIMEVGDHLDVIRDAFGRDFPLVIVGKIPERMRLFDKWDAQLWLITDSGKHRVRIFFSKGDGEGMEIAYRYLAIKVLDARRRLTTV